MRAFIVFASTLAVASAGLLAPVVAPGATQYHAQDELGQYSYGYSGGPSSKVETKTADGVVRGSWSHIDGNGIVQTTNYVSDPINGFRVAATNLPVGPAPAQVVAAPLPVAYAAAPQLAYAGHPIVRSIATAPAATVIGLGQPTYTAYAAPLNNGAVHSATLPLPPVDTPEVQLARAQHLAAKLG